VTLALEIVLGFAKIPASTVWERLYSSHRPLLDSVDLVQLSGKRCGVQKVGALLGTSPLTHFRIEWDRCSLDYSHVANSELSFVSAVGCIRDEIDAGHWLGQLCVDDAFRQSRVYDSEYEYWQNAQDPLEYETHGRSYAQLPTRTNGLPPPLEQRVIDTSDNPGRRVLRRGFIEAVGSTMWLGSSFWTLSGANPNAVCKQDWLRCDTIAGQIVRLNAADAPFSTADGESGERQARLRSLLYPIR
jgi:hypothetical protein